MDAPFDGEESTPPTVYPEWEDYITDWDSFLWIPIQHKYATYKEARDGTYDLLEWLELNIAIMQEERFKTPTM